MDKLEPEIGQLSGPKPVLFRKCLCVLVRRSCPYTDVSSVGCDETVLISSNVGHVKFAENSADFGAEQVILVHDQVAKTKLQAAIGDAALVLTILQSKGMEFDDVILWNFFSECPYPAGIRSLATLVKDEPGAFDPRKHVVSIPYRSHARETLMLTANSECVLSSRSGAEHFDPKCYLLTTGIRAYMSQ